MARQFPPYWLMAWTDPSTNSAANCRPWDTAGPTGPMDLHVD